MKEDLPSNIYMTKLAADKKTQCCLNPLSVFNAWILSFISNGSLMTSDEGSMLY